MINRLLKNPYSEKLDRLRFNALVAYCLFQVGYAVVLMAYAIFVRREVGVLLPTAITSFVLMIVVIFAARWNYKVVTILFVVFSCTAQSAFMFAMDFSRAMNIMSIMVFLMLAILAFAVIGRAWGIVIFVLCGIALVLNYVLNAPNGFVEPGDFYLVQVHVGAYMLCLFGFVAYLIVLFEQYMKLYLAETTRTQELNTKLEETISSINDMNCDLEEHVSALSDANAKLARYAWTHAHEVKAPVARILGLLNVRKLDQEMDNEYFLSCMTDASNELSSIVDRMNSILGEVDIEQYLNAQRREPES